ncbi:MAG: TonB-dependent receptor [Alteraurantiacibacter sp.]
MNLLRFKAGLSTSAALLAMAASPAYAQQEGAESDVQAQSQQSDNTIVVTARRTDEDLQDVPLSVAAFSSEALNRSTVQELSDVRVIAPGLNFNSEGGKNTINVSLRGLGQLPVGLATPGVVTYVNNVAIPSLGSSIPTFDLSDIQVLKGPQGTLFGKTTLGGAILINTAPAVDYFEGYVQATYGRYDYFALEGALNIPLVDDTAALRVAGQIRRQDPRTPAIDNLLADASAYPGFANVDGVRAEYPGFDDIDQNSARITLSLTPGSRLTNTTVFEYFEADELASSLYAFGQGPGFAILGFSPAAVANFTPLFGGPAGFNQFLANGVTAQGVSEANPRGAFDGGINGGRAYRETIGVVNRFEYELTDNLTFRNIVGYRDTTNEQLINTSGLPLLDNGGIDLDPRPSPNDLITQPLIVYYAAQQYRRDYLDIETQMLWESDGLNAIVGLYYSEDGPSGESGSAFTQFSPFGLNNYTTEHVKNRNISVFGQASIDLTEALTFTLGARYGWDKQEFCYLPASPAGPLDYDGCLADVEASNMLPTANVDAKSVGSTKDSALAWTIGLDYQVNPDLLVYVTSRRGYRPSILNYPTYESPQATGDPTACGGFQCADLRGFQTVDQERVTDIEIGEKLVFESGNIRGRFNVALFYSWYDNAIQFISNSSIPALNFAPDRSPAAFITNAANLNIYGVEADFSISPTRNLTLSLNGAYTKTDVAELLPIDTSVLPGFGSFTDDSVNRLTPKYSGTASFSWTLPFRPLDGDVVLNGDLYVTDDFGGQQGFQLEGYELANARIDWNEIGGTGLDLGFYVKNVFNATYQSGVSILLPNQPFNSLYIGPPRTWGVEARYSF